MFEQMKAICSRFEELGVRLSQPETAADSRLYCALMKEYRELSPVVDAYRAYQKAQDHLRQAQELLDGTPDADFREIIQQELCENRQAVAQREQALKLLLLPRDETDERNIILEVRAGAGGEEAALFAHSLCRMYAMYAQRHGWQMEPVSLNETELGGTKEAVFSVSGTDVYGRLKYESGVHRVQRVPETETQGRIHTSTATVSVMPQAEAVEFELDMKDLRIDTFRSSGAGGQHINKTSSAIRVTHIPTGMVVECQNERSQYQNKDKALEVLRSRLFAQKQQARQDEINAARHSQVGSGDRSEKIRTYNFPQDRVSDHRIALTVHHLDGVLNGELDEIIDALAAQEQQKKLAGGAAQE
jgi:peptide chain release factor 1